MGRCERREQHVQHQDMSIRGRCSRPEHNFGKALTSSWCVIDVRITKVFEMQITDLAGGLSRRQLATFMRGQKPFNLVQIHFDLVCRALATKVQVTRSHGKLSRSSLRRLCVLGVSAARFPYRIFTAEAQRTPRGAEN